MYKFLASIVFFVSFNCYSSQFGVELESIERFSLPAELSDDYQFYLDLKIYKHQDLNDTVSDLLKIVKRAQEKFDDCKIYLHVGEVFEVKTNDEFSQWETFWFSGTPIPDSPGENDFTIWEREFFKVKGSSGPSILFVDSLNWTFEGQGTWAAAYAPFLLESYLPTAKKQRTFFKKVMQGTSVIGRFRAPWTVAHELGHALLNLRHINDLTNVMNVDRFFFAPRFDHDNLLITDRSPRFSAKQCKYGIKNSNYLRVIKR